MIDLETELNGPQLKAATTLEGAILIIAGAGSGKTRVITYRISRMLEKGIPQSAILALTFTNKAAREMESRVKELAGEKLQSSRATTLTRLTISTFHAFGVKLLRDEIEALGYRKNFSIYDSTDKLELIKECMRECRLYGEKTDLKKMEALFSNIKIGRMQWGTADGTGRYADDTWKVVYDEYQKSLKVYNALDFDDLLVVPIKLFEEHPEILEKYRRRYRYILVDEFQDTSLIQYKLLRLLANPDGGKSNVCVVGDDDQSIYSWRGANYENLLLFEKDFPNALEIKLEQNYRSTSTILEAANGLISHNTNRKNKTLWSGNGEGRPIIISYPQNETAEAASIADMIKKLRFAEQRNFSDFGVLVRTNNQFDVIEEAFLAENIPYKVSGGKSFFERKEVRDILSYLRVIANHDDDVNLLRIVNTPRRGIGKAAIQGASELAKKNHSSLYDALYRFNLAKQHGQETLFQTEKEENSSKTGIEEFLELIQTLRDDFFSSYNLAKNVRGLVDKIDYWSYLVSEYSKDEKMARWKFSNVEYLIRMIEDWERDPDNLDKGLYAYLNRISLLTRADGDDEAASSTKGKTNLMTIHASKGLEFPVVFIAGAEEGTIPHEKSIAGAETFEDETPGAKPIEEERRLFYVAITRAREKLYITSCQKRRRRDAYNERSPSPFLEEIPQGLIEYVEEEIQDSTDEVDDAEDFFARMKKRFGS